MPNMFKKCGFARLWQSFSGYNNGAYTFTLPNQSIQTITSAIVAFNPTFLTSVTRIEVGQGNVTPMFPAQMISDLNYVYNTLKAANPSVIIDIALRGSSYGSNIAQMLTDMQAAVASGLLFDSYSTYGVPTGDFTPVVQLAQSQGKLLGGALTSIPTNWTPAFQIFEDIGFQPLTTTDSGPWNAANIPVLFTHQNGATIVTTVPTGFPAPSPSETEHAYFVENLTPAQQLQIIALFAQGQPLGNYIYIWPLAYPQGTIDFEADYIAEGIMPQILSLSNASNTPVTTTTTVTVTSI